MRELRPVEVASTEEIAGCCGSEWTFSNDMAMEGAVGTSHPAG